MSEHRCLKLMKKLNECKEKNMHPKVIRRLENKLRGAIAHQVQPEFVNKVQSLFQSARCTLLTIINGAIEFTGERANTTSAKSQLDAFKDMSISPELIKLHGMNSTQGDVLSVLRLLALNFTKINEQLHANMLLLAGMLSAFYSDGYTLLGINKEDFNLDPYFNKCELLSTKIFDLILEDMGKK